MKIVIFAPHPDDEVLGCGGSILKWIEDGHEVHVIYITDNRALFLEGHVNDQIIQEEAKPYTNLTEDKLAEIGLKEAQDAALEMGISQKNIHLLKIHDFTAINNIALAVSISKDILKETDRIVTSSDNNPHPDHQAANTIAKELAKELNLSDVEFYVYALYVALKPPKEKLTKINIVAYRDRVYEIMKRYKTQLCFVDTRNGWKYLKRKRYERFGVFSLNDIGKFYNF